jgi:hypothetical protein
MCQKQTIVSNLSWSIFRSCSQRLFSVFKVCDSRRLPSGIPLHKTPFAGGEGSARILAVPFFDTDSYAAGVKPGELFGGLAGFRYIFDTKTHGQSLPAACLNAASVRSGEAPSTYLPSGWPGVRLG